MADSSPYDLYRDSSVGTTLLETLDELIHTGRITGCFASKIVGNFDRIVPQVLGELKDRKHKFSIKARVIHYNSIEDSWWWTLDRATLNLPGEGYVTVDKFQVFAYPEKKKQKPDMAGKSGVK
jgi:transcription initiation factor TFIIA small subunit